MELSEKELLLKDLSARLPYGVKAQVRINVEYSDAHKPNSETWIGDIWGITTNKPYTAWVYSFITIYPCGPEQNMCSISECKPYLRSMATMTYEEKREFNVFGFEVIDHINAERSVCPAYQVVETKDTIGINKILDWLNTHHFDFHNLIERGLAIEAPEGMYDIKS